MDSKILALLVIGVVAIVIIAIVVVYDFAMQQNERAEIEAAEKANEYSKCVDLRLELNRDIHECSTKAHEILQEESRFSKSIGKYVD